ncbi:hypothetical protein [Rubellimicrobium arenae]|uniref:hypothetical protein n=1 Tax=Rubellimicrobium arenae TaxID=2817372 RepID=UPI001B31297C|nr:hypothetical protein [Rubellimicrobium arenae]
MRCLAVLPLLLAGPAFAQDTSTDSRTFQPPQGCTAYLTVQMASCTVSHHFRCEGDPEGWQRRVDMDESGITYFGAIDQQTQWMESYHVMTGHSEILAPSPADPADFDALTANKSDSFDFMTNSAEIGSTRYVGRDRLTGKTVTIDDVPLEQTEYEITAYDGQGNEVWRSAGNEYISRDWRMFLSGKSSNVVGEDVTETDDSPVEFIFPGEPGFLSVSPKHGCNEVMSSYDAPLMSPIPESHG